MEFFSLRHLLCIYANNINDYLSIHCMTLIEDCKRIRYVFGYWGEGHEA